MIKPGDTQEYPIKVPPGPACPGCKCTVEMMAEDRGHCFHCGLDFADAFLRPKVGSGLEEFKAFFEKWGVPFDHMQFWVNPRLPLVRQGSFLQVGEGQFRFDEDDKFTGIYNVEESCFYKCLIEPEENDGNS